MPKPPFRFIEEDSQGSSPKLKVRDARGSIWSVKWGPEVNSDVFASRLAWASGYVVQPMHFVARGKILGAKGLKRADKHVAPDGTFVNARFQLRDPSMKFLDRDWSWNDNPFEGTREWNGLRIVMMLTSNWDNKDARDASRGSNTGILQYASGGRTHWAFFVADWGGSMGKWGGLWEREKWDCEGYAEQTPDFIKGVDDGIVEWGFHGQHTSSQKKDIAVADVKWLLRYAGRITDSQLRAGLRASGATAAETACFTKAIRSRINQMRAVASRNR